jgi:hypothetical protein
MLPQISMIVDLHTFKLTANPQIGTLPTKQKQAPSASALKIYIRASPDSPINSNGNIPSSYRCTIPQCIESSWCTVQLSSAMVGDDHAIEAVMNCELNVFASINFAIILE